MPGSSSMMSVPVMSDGLSSLELKAEGLGEGADKKSFGGAGEPGDKAMSADKQRDKHLLQNFFLTDDDAPDLPHDIGFHGAETVHAAFQNIGFQLRVHGGGHGVGYVFSRKNAYRLIGAIIFGRA